MKSFYLTNSNFEENSLSILNKQLISYPKLKAKNFSINFFYSSKNESLYKNGQNFISNLGVFIYKNNYNKKALKIFLDDLLSGKSLNDLLLSEDTRGQFCLILYFNNELKIISDRLGYFPVYI